MGWMPCFSITLGTHGIPGPLIQGSLVEKENLDRKKNEPSSSNHPPDKNSQTLVRPCPAPARFAKEENKKRKNPSRARGQPRKRRRQRDDGAAKTAATWLAGRNAETAIPYDSIYPSGARAAFFVATEIPEESRRVSSGSKILKHEQRFCLVRCPVFVCGFLPIFSELGAPLQPTILLVLWTDVPLFSLIVPTFRFLTRSISVRPVPFLHCFHNPGCLHNLHGPHGCHCLHTFHYLPTC